MSARGLFAAVQREYFDVLSVLLSEGIDPSSTLDSTVADTPLHVAVRTGNVDICRVRWLSRWVTR